MKFYIIQEDKVDNVVGNEYNRSKESKKCKYRVERERIIWNLRRLRLKDRLQYQ